MVRTIREATTFAKSLADALKPKKESKKHSFIDRRRIEDEAFRRKQKKQKVSSPWTNRSGLRRDRRSGNQDSMYNPRSWSSISSLRTGRPFIDGSWAWARMESGVWSGNGLTIRAD